MIQMSATLTVLASGVLLLQSNSPRGGELPSRASLAEIQAIGRVIVTPSSGSVADQDLMRETIDRRLAGAGIALDPSLDTHLVASVDVFRDTSRAGQKHVTYVISVSLEEPVRTVREPATTLRATTWSRTIRLSHFAADVPIATVLDALDRKMGDFVKTVAVDR